MPRCFAIGVVLLLVTATAGCQFGHKPRRRLACGPIPSPITWFLDPNDLGPHGYAFNPFEKNGIVYTCKAGHIDITHLRVAADWTKYFAEKSFKHLMANDTSFSFKFKKEPSRYYVQITYSRDWATSPTETRERIAREVSVAMGAHFAFTAATWHEILTWFGYKSKGLVPEQFSSFSWEDSFSNLLGARIAAQVLEDAEQDFDKAMTSAIRRELEELDAQPAYVASGASEAVRGVWFPRNFLSSGGARMRNLDIGLGDGHITPSLVPGLRECEGATAQSYPVPSLDCLRKHGFSMKLEIEPKEWEKNKILGIIYPDAGPKRKRIDPAVHFWPIMSHIERQTAERYAADNNVQHGN